MHNQVLNLEQAVDLEKHITASAAAKLSLSETAMPLPPRNVSSAAGDSLLLLDSPNPKKPNPDTQKRTD